MRSKLLVTAGVLTGLTATAFANGTDDAQIVEIKPASEGPQQRGYLAVLGVVNDDGFVRKGFALDGGTRVRETSWYVRGQLSAGEVGFSFGDPRYFTQARVGVESRACTSETWGGCVHAGADVGVSRDEQTETEVATGVMVIPRAGFELGSRLLLRAGLELPVYKQVGGMEEDVRGLATVAGAQIGIGVSVGVGVGF